MFELESEMDYRPDWVEPAIIPPRFTLNPDQQKAVDAIMQWMGSGEPYFLLFGAAGTGKTYAVQALIDQINGKIVFTAPTNKATKVLRATLTSDQSSW